MIKKKSNAELSKKIIRLCDKATEYITEMYDDDYYSPQPTKYSTKGERLLRRAFAIHCAMDEQC